MANVVFSADTDDSGGGTDGTIHNNAWKQAMATAVNVGFAWTTPTFAGGDFTANGAMTWTVASGDIGMNRFIKLSELMIWVIQINTSTIAGTPNTTLILKIPGGATLGIVGYSRVDYVNDNGTIRDNCIITGNDATHIQITITSGANWAASTNNTYIYFSIMLAVA